MKSFPPAFILKRCRFTLLLQTILALKSADLKEFSRLCDHEVLNAILPRYKRQRSIKIIDFIVDIRNETTIFLSG